MRMDEVDDYLLERLVALRLGDRAVGLVRELATTYRVVAIGCDDFAFLFPGAMETLRAIPGVATDEGGLPAHDEIASAGDGRELALVLLNFGVNGVEASPPAEAWQALGIEADLVLAPVQQMAADFCAREVPSVVGEIRARYERKRISFVILSGLDNHAALEPMLDSFVATTRPRAEIDVHVVLNGSGPRSAEIAIARLAGRYDHHLHAICENRHVTGGVIAGLAAARGDYVCLLQDDVTLSRPGWDEELAAALDRHPHIGVLGGYRADYLFRIDDRSDSLAPPHQHVSTPLVGPPGWPLMSTHLVEVDTTLSMCMMLRRELAHVPNEFLPNGFNDISLCLEARDRGFAVYATDAGVVHGRSAARSAAPSPRSPRNAAGD